MKNIKLLPNFTKITIIMIIIIDHYYPSITVDAVKGLLFVMIYYIPNNKIFNRSFVVLHMMMIITIEPLVAPYVDVTRMKDEDYLVRVHQATGLSAVTLAFVLGGTSGCEPTWGGEGNGLNDAKILGAIKKFQQTSGGKVILATGGAMGPYIETSCHTPADLAAAYRKALTTVGSNHLDIDIGKT